MQKREDLCVNNILLIHSNVLTVVYIMAFKRFEEL
jgi:hypothetical protein